MFIYVSVCRADLNLLLVAGSGCAVFKCDVVIGGDGHQVVDDLVEKCETLFSSPLLKWVPSHVFHHAGDATGSLIVIFNKSCCPSLYVF